MTDLLRRSVDTFIQMQEEYLKIAGKQTHTWVDAAKAGKPYQPEHMVDLAREGMENFVKAQKRFLDVVAEETAKATSGKHANGAGKKMKQTELSDLARKATDSFIEAQKRLVDVAGRQMNANVKTAGKDAGTPEAIPISARERTHARGGEELCRCPESLDGCNGQAPEWSERPRRRQSVMPGSRRRRRRRQRPSPEGHETYDCLSRLQESARVA